MIIEDSKIKHVWECGCGCKTGRVIVHPDFYENNGTPICDDGNDMRYEYTEISNSDLAEIVKSVIEAIQ